MLIETWTPGFIPDLLKAGQILLGLSVGLLLGHMKNPSRTNSNVKGMITTKVGVCLSALALGIAIALLYSHAITSVYLLSTIFVFTVLTSSAVAANITNKSVIMGLTWLSFFILGLTCVPLQGLFPDGLIIIAVNILSLSLLAGGAATLSNWTAYSQDLLWPKIGTRILGAWLFAVAIMMLAFQQSGISF